MVSDIQASSSVPVEPAQNHDEVEYARLQALAESYRSSARLHGMRADGLQGEIAHLQHQISLIRHSLSWRVTTPIRAVRSLTLGRLPDGTPLAIVKTRFREKWEQGGIAGVRQAIRSRLPRRHAKSLKKDLSILSDRQESLGKVSALDIYRQTLAETAFALTPCVLIIAELGLRQCAKYRVWQKKNALGHLGWNVRVVDWRDTDAAMTALQCCTQVIFYRTPGFESVMTLVAEAHRLRLAPRWEVDDLIFDQDQYRQNGNLSSLTASEREEILFGVRIFRACMLACGRGIASTRALAREMRKAGLSEVSIIENALDTDTLAGAAAIERDGRMRSDGRVIVVYGSGTNTHDADFRQAATGLLAAMQEEPSLHVRIVGQLSLPKAFDRFRERVERVSGMAYRDYLALLADSDISIAPLERTLFNDAKSNIKYLEASIVGVASICSPRDAFLTVMRNDENGILADSDEAWRAAFVRLARDAGLRQRLADTARVDVEARYAPDRIAEAQVLPVFGKPQGQARRQPGSGALRVMMANVYFAPRSFGGATIVVEEMCRHLVAAGVDVSMFTSRPHLEGVPNGALRYVTGGVDVLSSTVPPDHDQVGYLDNPKMAEWFGAWVDAVRPDVLHVHALQGLGTALLRLCQERGIPYVLTVHDAWWLCDRQFMVKEDGRYCFQKKIDLRVCQECLPAARHLEDRASLMHQALMGADLILSPSESHQDLYLANGIAPDRIVVNRNGFSWPARPRAFRNRGGPVRFGFIGGTEVVKGYPLIRKAFESLKRSDWELVLVDNKLNLGFSSIDVSTWKLAGSARVVAAFGRETVDDFFDQIDVLLFPSQWKESYGLSVREALARDVWVVTTAPGGQADDVRDGVNGTYIPLDGKMESLRDAMVGLMDSASRFDGYVNPFKGELPSFDTQARELRSLLEGVVARRGEKDVI